MADQPAPEVRRATVADAADVAELLHDFNTEFATPSPGVTALADRLRELLAGPETVALLAGRPPVAVALVTFRPNVWCSGPVALLDELYVVPHLRDQGIGTDVLARFVQECRDRGCGRLEINVDEGDTDTRRFYERHGFSPIDPDAGELALCYSMELDG